MAKKVHSHKSEQYALMGETQAYIKHLDDTEKWKEEVRAVGYNLIKELKKKFLNVLPQIVEATFLCQVNALSAKENFAQSVWNLWKKDTFATKKH